MRKYRITVMDDAGVAETAWEHESVAEQQVIRTDVVLRLLDENLELKQAMAALRDEAAPALRERFLTELLWGASPDDITQRLELYDLDQAPYKTVIVFEVDMNPKEPALAPAPRHIMRIIREYLSGRCKSTVFMSATAIIAVTARDAPGLDGELIGIVNEICAKCMKMLELRVTAGIGHCYDSLDNLHDSFLEAKTALEYKSVAGSGKAIYIDDVQRGQLPYANPGENLFSAVRFGSGEQIAMHISDIEGRMSGADEWERQACIFNLLSEVYQLIERYELYNEKTVMDILELNIGSPSGDLSGWFLGLCMCMSEHIKLRRERAPHSLSEEAKRFIELHYHESGLSVERLCEYLHVSQSYFSTVFKHETGVSYVQYLTELRMNRAVALLQQTDDRTYLIANKVGYDDPNYFSYVFKKRFGVSPAKYRKSAREL